MNEVPKVVPRSIASRVHGKLPRNLASRGVLIDRSQLPLATKACELQGPRSRCQIKSDLADGRTSRQPSRAEGQIAAGRYRQIRSVSCCLAIVIASAYLDERD